MPKDTFTLYTDRDGRKIELERDLSGNYYDPRRADIHRLLELTTQADELTYADYAEIEAIAKRSYFEFDDDGDVREAE